MGILVNPALINRLEARAAGKVMTDQPSMQSDMRLAATVIRVMMRSFNPHERIVLD